MAGQKRARSGEPKSQSAPQPQQPRDVSMTDAPPYGQTQLSSRVTDTKAPPHAGSNHTHNAPKPRSTPAPKRPRLPPNATASKRPLLHPALASPFASASTPKVLYITRTSPFIPTCKRIRALLAQISKRAAQSKNEPRGRGAKNRAKRLEANGRLSAHDVEASIVEAVGTGKSKSAGSAGEEVYLKATGRAIPRALELGVRFQGEDDCRVRVEMGSVKAIDDVEMASGMEGRGEGEEEEEVPETRVRTLSTVTVCIGLA